MPWSRGDSPRRAGAVPIFFHAAAGLTIRRCAERRRLSSWASCWRRHAPALPLRPGAARWGRPPRSASPGWTSRRPSTSIRCSGSAAGRRPAALRREQESSRHPERRPLADRPHPLARGRLRVRPVRRWRGEPRRKDTAQAAQALESVRGGAGARAGRARGQAALHPLRRDATARLRILGPCASSCSVGRRSRAGIWSSSGWRAGTTSCSSTAAAPAPICTRGSSASSGARRQPRRPARADV